MKERQRRERESEEKSERVSRYLVSGHDSGGGFSSSRYVHQLQSTGGAVTDHRTVEGVH